MGEQERPEVATKAPVWFEGIDRAGIADHGTTTEEIGPFVDRRFRAGWRWLSVERAGEFVGGITTRDGRRVWWAENAR